MLFVRFICETLIAPTKRLNCVLLAKEALYNLTFSACANTHACRRIRAYIASFSAGRAIRVLAPFRRFRAVLVAHFTSPLVYLARNECKDAAVHRVHSSTDGLRSALGIPPALETAEPYHTVCRKSVMRTRLSLEPIAQLSTARFRLAKPHFSPVPAPIARS